MEREREGERERGGRAREKEGEIDFELIFLYAGKIFNLGLIHDIIGLFEDTNPL